MGERDRRAALVAEGIQSARLEGGDVTDDYRRDAQDYIEGRVDADALIARTRTRYGLPPL